MTVYNDYALIKQCISGDTRAFDSLVDRYQKPIFNIALKMVDNTDIAEDITQTVFLKAFHNLKAFSPKYKFFSWIYRIAINESTNYLKAQRRYEQLESDFRSKEKTPEQHYLDQELQERIQDTLMALEPHYRAVIILRHFEELSYPEIGYVLDIPEKKVKSRLFTARQKLREILVQQGMTE